MRRILACVVVLTLVTLLECKFRYDYNYHSSIDTWLKFHDVPGTWLEAQQRCYLEGAVLATPFDDDWQNAIVTEMNTSEYPAIYTGIHSIFSKGYFHSIEGVSLDEMPLQWMPGEPDNFENGEDCIAFTGVRIADVNCSKVLPFLCYKKNSDMSVMPCGTVDREYEFVTKTGSCYKYHNKDVPWADAYKTCVAEGAYLAIINSKAEADVLKDKYPQQSNYDTTSIGIYDWYKDGVWRTVHGQTLEEAGYAVWENGQPNKRSPGQYCGGMFSNGTLNDFWCDRPTKFLCEKDPESLQD